MNFDTETKGIKRTEVKDRKRKRDKNRKTFRGPGFKKKTKEKRTINHKIRKCLYSSSDES